MEISQFNISKVIEFYPNSLLLGPLAYNAMVLYGHDNDFYTFLLDLMNLIKDSGMYTCQFYEKHYFRK